MVTITSGSLSSGSSIATGYTIPQGITVSRSDIVGPASRYKLKTVESSAKVGSYIFPADLGQHYMTIAVSTATRKTSIGGGTKTGSMQLNTSNYIRLPLPENIKDINETEYTTEGAVSLSSLTSAFSKFTGADSFFNPLADAKIGNELKAKTGVAPNQMLTILLKGPKYKSHSFTWKLYPRNKKESDMIASMIELLKTSSRPGLGAGSAFFLFPHLFGLSFTLNSRTNSGYMFKFKPTVLNSVLVNYTPSGQPSLYRTTGAPDGVELTLNFTEVEYWLSDDTISTGQLITESLTAVGQTLGLSPNRQDF
jgi:hypothetical protein